MGHFLSRAQPATPASKPRRYPIRLPFRSGPHATGMRGPCGVREANARQACRAFRPPAGIKAVQDEARHVLAW
jgi:hypothetical protein